MEWQPIETAPTLDRVFVAGWQARQGSVRGYWYFHEDVTDEKGIPIGTPQALYWHPLPEPPPFFGPNGEIP